MFFRFYSDPAKSEEESLTDKTDIGFELQNDSGDLSVDGISRILDFGIY